MVVNFPEFCEIVGATAKTVTAWIEKGMPLDLDSPRQGTRRRINTAKAIRWIRAMERAAAATPDGGETLAEAELRKARAAADFAEARAAAAQGESMALVEVEEIFDRAVTMCAAQLDGLAGRLAATVAAESDPAVCRQVIFDETRRIRESFAAEFEARATVEESEGVDGAAPGEDGGPVGGRAADSPPGQRRGRPVAERAGALYDSDRPRRGRPPAAADRDRLRLPDVED